MIRIRTEGALFKRVIQQIGEALAGSGRADLKQAVLNRYTQAVETQDDLCLACFLGTVRHCGSYSDFAAPFYMALGCDELDPVSRFTIARSLALHLVLNNRPDEAADVARTPPEAAAKRRLAVCIGHSLWEMKYHATAFALLEEAVPESREAILDLWERGANRAKHGALSAGLLISGA